MAVLAVIADGGLAEWVFDSPIAGDWTSSSDWDNCMLAGNRPIGVAGGGTDTNTSVTLQYDDPANPGDNWHVDGPLTPPFDAGVCGPPQDGIAT